MKIIGCVSEVRFIAVNDVTLGLVTACCRRLIFPSAALEKFSRAQRRWLSGVCENQFILNKIRAKVMGQKCSE